MQAPLTGPKLALYYSGQQIQHLKKKLQAENIKVIKQRMRNQEHVVHIQKLQSTILSKDKQIESLYEQLAKVQDTQTAFQRLINEQTNTNYKAIIVKLNKIQQLEQFFKAKQTKQTVQSYLQIITESINVIISKMKNGVDETSILCNQINTLQDVNKSLKNQVQSLQNDNESLKNQILVLQKVSKEKKDEDILTAYQQISRRPSQRNNQMTQQLYQIADTIRMAAQRLLNQI